MKILLFIVIVAMTVTAQAQDMAKGLAAYQKKNYSLAFKYFDAEARKDKPDPDAFYFIGQYYEKGLGMKKNPAEALTLYKLGSQTPPYSLKAILELIDIYRTGRNGIEKDPQGAFMWAKTLHQLDTAKRYPESYYLLADMHWKGIGTAKNLEEAASLLSVGANYSCKPCIVARKTLGLETYQLGLAAFQKKDYVTAVKYYKASVKAKNADAMIALGDLYYAGLGTFQSKGFGDDLYDRAAGEGNELAIKKRLPEVTNEHQLYVLKSQMRQSDGSFKPFPYLFTGKALIKWDNGETYDGAFYHGNITGDGKKYNSKGELLAEGSFLNGQLSYGTVTSRQPDGSVYKGTYIDGKAQGYGELVSKTGSYQGEWRNGFQNGTGRFLATDGTIYWGTYINGKLEGEGTVIFADGRKAKGSFSGGEMKGRWDYYNYKTGYLEARDYTSTGVFTVYKKPEVQSNRAELARQSKAYDEWWQKTYGRGGTQSAAASVSNNTASFSFRTGGQTEAERHQKAMDQIYRDTEKQMKRSFQY